MLKRILSTAILSLLLSSIILANTLPSKTQIVSTIKTANDYWQSYNSNHNRAFWDNATYHTGNMAAYELTKLNRYKEYSQEWAEYNLWMGAKSDNKEDWRYSYGESDHYVLFGDWQICFQTYIDLFNYSSPKDSSMISRALEVMKYQMSTENNDYWWWADGLYMVMPVMTKLYKITNNELFLEKLYEYFRYAQSIMYDEDTGLFYRDANYVYPTHMTNSEQKDFWARGDGWVFAGLAKVIEDMPQNYMHRDYFVNIFTRMAASLKTAQQDEGHWTRSLLDPNYAPGYETSGTAFFTFGMAWGINAGLLGDDYVEVVEKGWSYLQNIALQSNGSIGYVQPIGASASPGTWVDENSTANFGTGAFLLAASEVVHLASGEMPAPILLYMDSIVLQNANELTIYFNDSLDNRRASIASHYLIDDVECNSATLLENHRSVKISFDQLSIGTHTVSINHITSYQGDPCENNESKSFTYLGSYTVSASGYEWGTDNTPEKTLDNNYETRWSIEGDSVWITYDLGQKTLVESVEIAFYNGHRRQGYFAIELSDDGATYHRAFQGASSGNSWELENYDIEDETAQYIRILGFGNSSNLWNSITEVKFNTQTIASTAQVLTHKLKSYPNPNYNGYLTVEGELTDHEYQVQYINSQGKIDYLTQVTAHNGHLSIYSPKKLLGLYIIKIQGLSKTFYCKSILK